MRLPRIQEGGNEMSLTPERLVQIIDEIQRDDIDPVRKDLLLAMLTAESDQILAECSDRVDRWVSQLQSVMADRPDLTAEQSMSLFATFLCANEIPTGHIHNMFVVAVHKLAGIVP
jgi:hypothetical protein